MKNTLCLLMAALFAAACSEQPVDTRLPEGFVYLDDVAPTIIQDMRYTTAYNFTGDVVPGYVSPRCILTEPAALALSRVQSDLRARGLTLKVYDCYRPQTAVDAFVTWADTGDESTKQIFYPDKDKAVLFPEGYIAARSGHSRGSTVDLAIANLAAADQLDRSETSCVEATGENSPLGQLDFGTAYDCFDTLSHTADSRIADAARINRDAFVEVMAKYGFENYPNEWWHFTFQPEPYPDTYFDFPVR